MQNTEKSLQIKSHEAYKTISEVAKLLELTTSTIRFWEKEFKQIKPYIINKRRHYSQSNISIIAKIKELLYKEGYTLNGAKKYFQSYKTITTNTQTTNLKDKIKKIINLLSTAKEELKKNNNLQN